MLTYHGFPNPEKSQRFEDVLERNLNDLPAERKTSVAGYNDRITWGNWRTVASERGLEMDDPTDWSVNDISTFVEISIQPPLEQGKGVMAGMWQRCADTAKPASEKGHIVRVTCADDAGVIIDEPYGDFTDDAGNVT